MAKFNLGALVRTSERGDYGDMRWCGALAVVVGDPFFDDSYTERVPLKRLSDGKIAQVVAHRIEVSGEQGDD